MRPDRQVVLAFTCGPLWPAIGYEFETTGLNASFNNFKFHEILKFQILSDCNLSLKTIEIDIFPIWSYMKLWTLRIKNRKKLIVNCRIFYELFTSSQITTALGITTSVREHQHQQEPFHFNLKQDLISIFSSTLEKYEIYTEKFLNKINVQKEREIQSQKNEIQTNRIHYLFK